MPGSTPGGEGRGSISAAKIPARREGEPASCPAGPCSLVIYAYGPSPAMVRGQWRLPALEPPFRRNEREVFRRRPRPASVIRYSYGLNRSGRSCDRLHSRKKSNRHRCLPHGHAAGAPVICDPRRCRFAPAVVTVRTGGNWGGGNEPWDLDGGISEERASSSRRSLVPELPSGRMPTM
jgi:hypothetical protein